MCIRDSHMTETIEHLTECVAFGTPQQKAAAASPLLSGSYLLMLEERIDRLAPVSYTHLDVYKRQVLPHHPAGRPGMNPATAAPSAPGKKNARFASDFRERSPARSAKVF